MNSLTCTNCGADNRPGSKYCAQCGYELPKLKIETDAPSNLQTAPPQRSLIKTLKAGIVFIMAFGLAYWGVQQLFFKPLSFDQVLVRTANEINKTCPIMIDDQTRLDNTVALPDNTFQYNYTLINLTTAEISLDTIKKYVEPGIINNVKTHPDMKIYRENKTTLIYYYNDMNGEFVYKLEVSPDKYQ